MKGGRPSDAKAAFEHALVLDPNYADARNTLGALLAQSGDLPGAVAHFRSAIEAHELYPDAMNNLGYALFQMGQRQEAYDLYQRALALRPDFPEALNNVGIFFGQQRDLRAGRALLPSSVRAASHLRRGCEQPGAPARRARRSGSGDRGARTVVEGQSGVRAGLRRALPAVCGGGPAAGKLLVLERLLQRNPTHPQGLQMLKQLQAGR